MVTSSIPSVLQTDLSMNHYFRYYLDQTLLIAQLRISVILKGQKPHLRMIISTKLQREMYAIFGSSTFSDNFSPISQEFTFSNISECRRAALTFKGSRSHSANHMFTSYHEHVLHIAQV